MKSSIKNSIKKNKSAIFMIMLLLFTALMHIQLLLFSRKFDQPLEKIGGILGLAVILLAAIIIYIKEMALEPFEKKFGERKVKIILYGLYSVATLMFIVAMILYP